MIVYGDPQFTTTLHDAIDLLDRTIRRIQPNELEGVRTLLIQAGQLEQAAADAGRADSFQALTDCVANAFVRLWSAGPSFEGLATELAVHLEEARKSRDATVTVKVPEGFEFYALYPEQYAAAALRWARDNNAAKAAEIVAVGIRSIGTTLSAVIAATLRLHGHSVRRVTVRPAGHPFQRDVKLERADIGGAAYGLIVDEGPGLSGSSMAAAAEALVCAGIPRGRLAFFPGNTNHPGPATSDAVRRWWKEIPRYFVPMNHELFGAVEDISAGGWRRFAYACEERWPPARMPFERMKLRSADGQLLWKFTGLGAWLNHSGGIAHDAISAINALAEQGWTASARAMVNGFVELRWIDGVRLSAGEGNERVGRYIVAASREALTEGEHDAGVQRLAHMLFWNTKEALGEERAERTRRVADAACERSSRSSGDGRLGPHEWIRTADQEVLKTDCFGHVPDHTVVGPQDILWDVAGAIIEWQLDERKAAGLLAGIEEKGVELARAALPFYQCAYAAFQMGMMDLCAQSQSSGSAEHRRLIGARDTYRSTLEQLLS